LDYGVAGRVSWEGHRGPLGDLATTERTLDGDAVWLGGEKLGRGLVVGGQAIQRSSVEGKGAMI